MLPDTGICSISPSDMMGQLDNMLSRIEDLEKTIAELKASNTEAIQLSDLSQSAGWIYDVTYMGTAGWTQTPAGTLIPPVGFTVSEILASAQANQLAAYASAGIIGGGGLSTAKFYSIVGTIPTGPSQVTFDWTTEQSASFATNNTTSITLTSGLYLITSHSSQFYRTSTTSASTCHASIGSSVGNNTMYFMGYWASGETTISYRYFNTSMVVRFPDALDGYSISGVASKTGSITIVPPVIYLGISRLGD